MDVKQKEKNCTYLIAALLAGVAFGIVAGFTLGWTWSKRQGALSDVRILDVLIAVGTIGAVIGATYSARAALQIAKEQRSEEMKRRRQEAISYMTSKLDVIDDCADYLGRVQDCILGRGDKKEAKWWWDQTAKMISLFREIDLDKANQLSEGFRRDIAVVIQKMTRIQIRNKYTGNDFCIPYRVEIINELRQKMVRISQLLNDEA